jgi:transketolase
MSMRKQLVTTVERMLETDSRMVLLLGDIGVFGFRRAFEQFPQRVYNVGILEQATVGMAAGLARAGLIPVVHTIAPFLVERSYEQIKIDFGYQALGGNFVSVGASYDYASLGCTHHCPGDVGILLHIPQMEITVPGTALEFDHLFSHAYGNGKPTYFRLSEFQNGRSEVVDFGKITVIQQGSRATVLAVGPMLDKVREASHGLDVAILYCTTVAPFDIATLRVQLEKQPKLLLVEPFYEGTLAHLVAQAAGDTPLQLRSVGVRREFLTHYGHASDHDAANGLTVAHLRHQLEGLLHA